MFFCKPSRFVTRTLIAKSFSDICSKINRMSAKNFNIVMVRHGESEWNQKNLFCGWYNAALSDKGRTEAKEAGKALKKAGYTFDIAFTSVLQRAQITLETILKEIGQPNLPVVKTWRLNERHYGGLTGLNKVETAEKYGEKQVKIWRRSYDVPPPPMEPDHPYYAQIVEDPSVLSLSILARTIDYNGGAVHIVFGRYADGPPKAEFPKFESLKLTVERTLPFWNETIIPQVKAGKKVIIAAHGNSLRGIVKHLDKMNEEQIMGINLPTGIPFLYTLDQNMRPVEGGSMQFLGDPETVKRAMESVANQGTVK